MFQINTIHTNRPVPAAVHSSASDSTKQNKYTDSVSIKWANKTHNNTNVVIAVGFCDIHLNGIPDSILWRVE